MRASVNIFLGRARNELPIAVKPRAVARAVPAGFAWIPLQLTAQMWATNVHYMEGTVHFLVNAHFFSIPKDDATLAGRKFRGCLGRNLKKALDKPFYGLTALCRHPWQGSRIKAAWVKDLGVWVFSATDHVLEDHG